MRDFKLGRFVWACVLGLSVALLGACATDSNVAPNVDSPSFGNFPAGAPTTFPTAPDAVVYEGWTLCKKYSGQVGPAVLFDIEVDEGDDGSVDHTPQVTLADGECVYLWIAGGNVYDRITVTENVPAGYTASYVIDSVTGTPPTSPVASDPSVTGNTATKRIHNNLDATGVRVTFTNTYMPPPGGGEGCTPGYWKNHTGLKEQTNQWPPTGYAQGDDYATVFGVSSSFTATLLGALNQGGGGEYALGRHAVAALLNASHPGVSYDLSAAEVIAAVQGAYASGDFEGVKDTLAWYNEQGCPIGN